MPKGPKGEKRPADVIGAAVKVMKIATGGHPLIGRGFSFPPARLLEAFGRQFPGTLIGICFLALYALKRVPHALSIPVNDMP